MYALNRICGAADLQEISWVGCNRYNASLTADLAITVTMITLAILAIVAYTTQTAALSTLQPLYPIGAYMLLTLGCVILVVDLAVHLAKGQKKEQIADSSELMELPFNQVVNTELSKTSYPSESVKTEAKKKSIFTTSDDTDLSKIDQLKALWTQLGCYLKLPRQDLKSFTKNQITEWFWNKMEKAQDKQLCIEHVIPAYLAWYFDIGIDCVHMAIFGSDKLLSSEAILASLELFKEEEVDEQLLKPLADSLKRQLKIQHEKKYGKIDGQRSPIEQMSWDEIELRHLLIFSEGSFYNLEKNSADYKYLQKQMHPEGAQKNPLTRAKFSPEDCALFHKKVEHLNLKPPIAIDTPPPPPPFESIERLILDLLSVRPGNEEVFIPYLEDLQHPAIQSLTMPLGSYSLVFSEINLRVIHPRALAISLAVALDSEDYSLQESTIRAITRAASAVFMGSIF